MAVSTHSKNEWDIVHIYSPCFTQETSSLHYSVLEVQSGFTECYRAPEEKHLAVSEIDPLQSLGLKYSPYVANSWYISLVQTLPLDSKFTQQLRICYFHLHFKSASETWHAQNQVLDCPSPQATLHAESFLSWEAISFFQLLRESSWSCHRLLFPIPYTQ